MTILEAELGSPSFRELVALKWSFITLDIVKNLKRGRTVIFQCQDNNGWTITVQFLNSNSWTVTVQDLNSNSSNINKEMITMVGQRTTIFMGVMRKNIKY